MVLALGWPSLCVCVSFSVVICFIIPDLAQFYLSLFAFQMILYMGEEEAGGQLDSTRSQSQSLPVSFWRGVPEWQTN